MVEPVSFDVNGFVNETVRDRGDRFDTAWQARRQIAVDLLVSEVSVTVRPRVTGS